MSFGRDVALGLSLANVAYLRVWSELLTYRQSDTFWMKTPPTPADYAAAMVAVLLIGAAIGLGLRWSRRMLPARLLTPAQWLFLLALAVPVNAVRGVLANDFPYLKSALFELIGQGGVVLLATSLALMGIVSVSLFHRRLTRLATGALLVLFPFVPVTFGQAMWRATRYDPTLFADKPLAAPLPVSAAASPRVVWILFDELDYRLAFVDRHPALQLTELDRLRAESLFAISALPPGPGTPESMPGYVTGRLIAGVMPVGPDNLLLQYKGSQALVPWGDQPNVFSAARRGGYNTAIIGWFHPYCRVLNPGLTQCAWWEMAMQHDSMGSTFAEKLLNQPRSLFETTLFSVFGQSLATKQHARTYQDMLARAKATSVDRRLGLILLHLPVPHAPHFYERGSGQPTLRNSPINGYTDSLALTDLTLGELRRSMADAGVWETTTVLVTSDHPYREAVSLDGKGDPRVPFILKLAGGSAALVYDSPFNTVLTHDLILAILRGELSTARDVSDWLDHHRGGATT